MRDKLKQLIASDWSEDDFGLSKLKADYKRQLNNIYLLDSWNKFYYDGEEIYISDSEVSYLAECNGKTYKVVSADVRRLKTKNTIKVTTNPNIPPFTKLVVDYLIGRLTFSNGQLYDVNGKQARVLDDFTVQNLYGFKRDNQFVLDIIRGIHSTLNIKPSRILESYKIAGNDFIIDLEQHTLTRTVIDNQKSFFKYYDVDYSTAVESKEKAKQFLNEVIADDNSRHNATLQPYYIAMVASGLKAKTNFFVCKSGVRTGKGLRHIALSGLFNKIDVELDNLTAGGFEALNAWSMFAGGELALATEQGDILGDKMERVLKIIATEKTHNARNIGGNQGLVNLSSVLSIDTNRTVAFSDEMNGRKVLIQYQDRPQGETDLERERYFSQYWNAFTNQDKSPKIDGAIGFLLLSLDHFKSNNKVFEWKHVELKNNEELDEFQMLLLNRLTKEEYVIRDYFVDEIHKKTYGTNGVKANKAMRVIGVSQKRKKIDSHLKTVYQIDKQERFNSFLDDEAKTNSAGLLSMFE